MKKSVLLLLLVVVSGCLSPSTQSHKSVIEPEGSEKWWGGAVSIGTNMPFIEQEVVDLSTTNLSNQTVPFLVSNKGRYIWSDEPFKFSFSEGILTVESDYEKIEPRVAGKTLREAYLEAAKNHIKPNGKIPAELLFTHPQYNTWIELMYNQNQQDIIKYADDILANDFPTGVIMIDDNWQRYYGSYDFKAERFPDPKGMVDYLNSKGFEVMLWLCPFVSPDSPEYRELKDKGYLIKDKRGECAMISWWNGVSACYDLTNPAAYSYVVDKLTGMQEQYGIAGFKFDAGDVSFYTDNNLSFFDKDATAITHSELWCQIGERFPYNEFRAAWKMGGRGLAQRLCDKTYSWEALQALVPDMIATSIMGHSFACPDLIGGGEFRSFLNIKDGEFDQKLITRSAQVHALMPMMQFSVAPWRVLDEKHLGYVRDAANLHLKMGGYILELAQEAAISGAPIVRAMEYEFPAEGFADCNDQFMLGEKYLVVPVTSNDSSRQVVLPKGEWKDDKGVTLEGPLAFSVDIAEDRLLYYERIRK